MMEQNPVHIGAEIFIEPGQIESEIFSWFEAMQKHGLTLTRIRMFENYMRNDENWDFKLFDIAFKAAEKYNIKIYANLFPETSFSDVGGFKFPKSEAHLTSIALYIKNVVGHFTQFKSLYGWVPINEPGSGSLPFDAYTQDRLRDWKEQQTEPTYSSNGFKTLDFSEKRFLVSYNTWFLNWLVDEIRKSDLLRPIHVNNHDIFKNAAEYDFPSWRSFLTSLGGSAHASWHFDYFKRAKFAVAMSANAEMLRSGAGTIPWYMTELQGGNNTYSGKRPLCPTKEEIAQWLWINIGSGSQGGMFWCLNPRRSGFEAGEWGMLNFQNEPTDRLLMASKVSETISAYENFFNNFQVYETKISVLYVRESLWIEEALQIEGTELEGRMIGGVMKSALSYFEALSELGVHAAFKEIAEFDFNRNDFQGHAIILSHQISIPSKYWLLITNFVALGGKLIVDGLTAYYDENACCILGENFPLADCFGSNVSEFKLVDEIFDLYVDKESVNLKAHLWQGSLKLSTANSIATEHLGTSIYGSRNDFHLGQVVYIPSLLGLGSRICHDYQHLCSFLKNELHDILTNLPITFQEHQAGMLLKVIRNEDSYLSIIVNKSGTRQAVKFNNEQLSFERIAFNSVQSAAYCQETLSIEPEETVVVEWTLKS